MEKSAIRPHSISAAAVVVGALCFVSSGRAIADIKEVENIPLTLKTYSFDVLKRKFPPSARVLRRKDDSGDTLVTVSEPNAEWSFRFTPSSELLNFRIERRLRPIEAYRDNIVSLIWQHGTPNYVVLPQVSGYPRGAAKACLSQSDQPDKLKLDVPCLEKHLPKEPAAVASWVNDSINRLGRHPDLIWTCKQSASGPKLIASKGLPGECFVKVSAGADCSGTGRSATCQQFIDYSNVELERERERLARASADDLIAEGKAALERNDPDTAINRFRRAEKALKEFSRPLHDLIMATQIKIQQRDWRGKQPNAAAPARPMQAPEPVQNPDEIRKQRISSAFRDARLAAALGKVDGEIEALGEVLKLDPENIDALRSRQASLEKMGRLELALKDAEKRVAINADDVFGQRDVTRLKRQIRAALQKVTTEKSTKAPSESAETLQIENLEKPYDINGLSLTADLSAIEAFLKGRAGSSFKRSESDGEVHLEGGADAGRWSVVYDANNGALLRAEFTSEKIPVEVKRETYAAIMRKYGMPFHIESDYGKLLAQRASSYSDASQELKDDFAKMDQCYSTCCGGSDSIKKCAPTPPVNACFNDCYYPKPPRDVEALLNWLFAEKAAVAQRSLLHDGVRSTYWSCSRLPAGDVLRNREQRTCGVRFDVNTYDTDFKYNLRFENASAIQRSDEQQDQIRKEKEKIEREKARQTSAQGYRNETAAKEARYAAIDDKIAKRYPYIAPERLEFIREKWRSYEDFKVWMGNELKQPYWQKIPEAEREAKLLDALTKNDYRPGGPNYTDPYVRNAAQDYLQFHDRRRSFDTDNTRAMIDKATTEPQFAAIPDEKVRRTAAIAELQKREPARMKAYFDELDKIRHCYNNGSVPAGKIGGVTTYRQAPGCWGYTTARAVNAGMAKRPSWEP